MDSNIAILALVALMLVCIAVIITVMLTDRGYQVQMLRMQDEFNAELEERNTRIVDLLQWKYSHYKEEFQAQPDISTEWMVKCYQQDQITWDLDRKFADPYDALLWAQTVQTTYDVRIRALRSTGEYVEVDLQSMLIPA